ncbi:MAG: M48 family metalloprotease [Acidiferrobacterales bacterium]
MPNLGQDAAAIISPYEERRIGEEAMVQIRQQLNFVDDPELSDYIRNLGKRLTLPLLDDEREYQFFLIGHPTINAFALPGGFIGTHSGLITNAASESELASVLAHEIAHVTQRHWPRLVAAQKERSGLTMAAILASLVLASSGDVNASGIAVAAMAADVDSQLAFTRGFEREADRIGIRLLAAARLDPRAMATFFERLAAANQFSGANIPEFMRTHPVTNDRIAEARNSATKLPQHGRVSSSRFYHFRARTRAYHQPDPGQALAHFSTAMKKKNIPKAEQRAAQYGLTLVHLRLGNFAVANKNVAHLRKQNPGELRYQLAEADIAIAAGRAKRGLGLYHRIYTRNRMQLWVARRYAENLLNQRQPRRALGVLRLALKQAPKDPALNKLMAKAAGETGNLVQAHRAMAEYYVISGNPYEAINQLGIAARMARKDYYALTAIRARTSELEAAIARNKARR